MFDQLDNVKSAWNDNRVIMLVNPTHSDEKITLVTPATIFSDSSMTLSRSLSTNQIKVVLSYELCKTLELPFIRTVYRAVSSRYPIVDYFLNQNEANKEISKSAISLAIDCVEADDGNTDKDIIKTINKIGDLVDQHHSHQIKKDEFVDLFRKGFKIPGSVPIVRSSLHLLKSKVSEYELSLALCDIAKYPQVSVISDLIDSKSGGYLSLEKARKMSSKFNIPIIDTKTTIDLWRSIFKIQKSQIAEF